MAIKITSPQLAAIASIAAVQSLSADLELAETADHMLAVTRASGKTVYVFPDGEIHEQAGADSMSCPELRFRRINDKDPHSHECPRARGAAGMKLEQNIGTCAGCKEGPTTLTEFAMINCDLILACTPLCLYQAVRERVEAENVQCGIDSALLHLTATELARSLSDWIESEDLAVSLKAKQDIMGCWERLEFVLKQIDLSPENPAFP